MDGVSRSKILIGIAANEQRIDGIVGPIFFRFFAPYLLRVVWVAQIHRVIILQNITVKNVCYTLFYCYVYSCAVHKFYTHYTKCTLVYTANMCYTPNVFLFKVYYRSVISVYICYYYAGNLQGIMFQWI